MSLPVQKRIATATPSPVEVSDGPAPTRSGLELLSAVVDLHPSDSTPSRKSPEGAEAFAPAAGGADRAPDAEEADRAQAGSPLQRDKKFPEVLMEILSNDEYAPAIGWLPGGKRFLIRDPNKLTSDILPKHFRRGANFLSFRRKLNRYGFNAVRQCVAYGGPVFEHKYFRRDRPDLLGRVYCKPKPTTGKDNLAKNSASGNGAAAAGAKAAASQVTPQFFGGVIVPVINSTESSITSNHAVAPSHGTVSAALAATQVPRGVPLPVTSSTQSGIVNVRAAAPSWNTLESAATSTQGALGALVSNNHAVPQMHHAASAVAAAGLVPRGDPLPLASSDTHDAAFRDLLESELLMRELKKRRQRALARILLDAHVSAPGLGL